jgi:hypothetical protein
MTQKTFDTLKFKRTYIGGSKKRELEIFNRVQGLDETNSESDWFEYRRIYTEYSYDLLNVLVSWRYILNIISHVLLILTILVALINIYVSITIFVLGIVSRLVYLMVKSKELNQIFTHDFVLKIVSEKIHEHTGLIITNY